MNWTKQQVGKFPNSLISKLQHHHILHVMGMREHINEIVKNILLKFTWLIKVFSIFTIIWFF